MYEKQNQALSILGSFGNDAKNLSIAYNGKFYTIARPMMSEHQRGKLVQVLGYSPKFPLEETLDGIIVNESFDFTKIITTKFLQFIKDGLFENKKFFRQVLLFLNKILKLNFKNEDFTIEFLEKENCFDKCPKVSESTVFQKLILIEWTKVSEKRVAILQVYKSGFHFQNKMLNGDKKKYLNSKGW